ncbi:phosphoribosylformimino-5-aminoimidazole carboxamide ribotide isomerase [Konateibacter massiliensis]|uniref:phosphoribosylformimino-5-aminoimidazole carboxamide ribotide isomerase n=1 Tax=Konateibacter massiliensis TaxID=2002841 RepID=UPI000C148512|nr:phosphoribosylformimino-5-aminoimidazole carboxamide ribotide isomerase [Konateibacter massiliensis]
MKFRPCIDIHNGKVKQIVGGSLTDEKNQAVENYVSEMDAEYYAYFYEKDGLKGGHIILLNSRESEYYEATKKQAVMALNAYKGGLQIGGGIQAENAADYLDAGASHVIVTSYVFQGGKIHMPNLEKIKSEVGKERLVLDLSCRRRGEQYYIVTDRWQNYTDVIVNEETLDFFGKYCDEFLIHAVDVEGKAQGIEKELAKMLGGWGKIPVTYAGGVGNFADLKELKDLGQNKLDVTIGSALDLFGGKMPYQEVLRFMSN